MPKMNGIELLAWLKRYHAMSNLPIIMYSTSLNKRETDYCLELGASVVLAKLFSLQDSIAQIKETLKTYLPAYRKTTAG
jgi:CheY-like chemotaxis protein